LCLTQHLQLHANPRDWKHDSTALLMDLFEEKFLANSMNSLTTATVAINFIED
jgi:hypothetical protein